MKKLLFSLLLIASSFSFANTPIVENEIKLEGERQLFNLECERDKNEEIICSTTCSRVIGGVTYTAEAGNWFSSCEGAAARCEKKLDKLSTLNTSF